MSRENSNSIKMGIVAPDALLNASSATNFTYLVVGHDFTDEEITRINAIDSSQKHIDRFKEITQLGVVLVFEEIDHPIFKWNLQMLDCCLIKILANMLVDQFVHDEKLFSMLVKRLAAADPLEFKALSKAGLSKKDKEREDIESILFEQVVKMYTYKLKHLLTSAALGMLPSKKWDGRYDANGGFLVVKKDGEVLCYHFYDKNRFEDYLFAHSYIERSDSSRCGWGKLFRGSDGRVYFKLNLQVRLNSKGKDGVARTRRKRKSK